VESGKLDVLYLHKQITDLTDHERIVTLMIDEVYAARRIEYSNGAFVGITEDGVPAKTVLSFMVQSSCSKYQGMVCLVPIDRLDTKTLQFWFSRPNSLKL